MLAASDELHSFNYFEWSYCFFCLEVLFILFVTPNFGILSKTSSFISLQHFAHLALARDGLVKQQTAAVLLVQARVFWPHRALPHTAQTGHPEGLEAVGREGRRRCGWVGLIAGGGPAPVAPRGAVAGRREGAGRTVVLPWAAQPLWEDAGRGHKKVKRRRNESTSDNKFNSFSHVCRWHKRKKHLGVPLSVMPDQDAQLNLDSVICTSHSRASQRYFWLWHHKTKVTLLFWDSTKTLPRSCFVFRSKTCSFWISATKGVSRLEGWGWGELCESVHECVCVYKNVKHRTNLCREVCEWVKVGELRTELVLFLFYFGSCYL